MKVEHYEHGTYYHNVRLNLTMWDTPPELEWKEMEIVEELDESSESAEDEVFVDVSEPRPSVKKLGMPWKKNWWQRSKDFQDLVSAIAEEESAEGVVMRHLRVTNSI